MLDRTDRHAGKELAMERDFARLLRPRHSRIQGEADADLTTCSLCMRVLRGEQWVQAELVIRELRSYDLPAPPRLRSAICDDCAEAILSRRAQDREPMAA
jgi:hypothetical protein